MEYFVAGLPIIVVVVLLVLRIPASIAVLTSIAVLLASFGMFPIDAATALASFASMGTITLTVAVIMYAGISLTNLQQLAGAQQSLSAWLNLVASSKNRVVLIFGLTLVPLIESLIGWGMGVIVVLPLLIGAGLSKLQAVQISLLGLMLCPWGSFSPALLLMSEITGYGLTELGSATAWCNVVVIAVLGITIVLVSGGIAQLKRMWLELMLAWAAMSAVLIAVNAWVTPPLGGVLSALAGVLVLAAFARTELRAADSAVAPQPQGSRSMPLLARRGLVPYALVLVGLAASTLAAPLIGSPVAVAVLTNPAVWLVLALMCTPFVIQLPLPDVICGLVASFRVFVPSALVTLLFIGFGMLIGMNGMGAKLAEGAASLGGLFVLLVPLTGFISGFVTSSNTASVAMFSEPLQSAAAGLGLDPVTVLGLHTAATGAGIMTNPSRAVLAIETAKLITVEHSTGNEKQIGLGRVLAPALWANLVVVILLTVFAAFQ